MKATSQPDVTDADVEMNPSAALCPLCAGDDGGSVVWRDAHVRVLVVDQSASPASFPGFCRVIWQAHVAEMTDLSPAERASLMATVWRVEQIVRDVMQPDKVNLACLGNMVPHLHWHIIPRWKNDSHFPRSIWDLPLRATPFNGEQDKRLARAGSIGSELTRRLSSAG